MDRTSDLKTLIRSVLRKASRLWEADYEVHRLLERARDGDDQPSLATLVADTLMLRIEGGADLLAHEDPARRLARLAELLQTQIRAEEEAALENLWLVLDAKTDPALRSEAARKLASALHHWQTSEFLRNALAARPLSASQAAEMQGVIARAQSERETSLSGLLGWVCDRQPQIAKVSAAFDQVSSDLFGTREWERERWRDALAAEGAFRALAFAPSEPTSMAREAAWVLTSRGVAPGSQHRAIVKAWTRPLVQAEATAGGPPREAFEDGLPGFFNDEVLAYNRAYDEEPQPVLPSRARANLYVIGGWLDSALADYDAVLAANPADDESRIERADILRSCGRLDEAIAEYDSVIERHVDNRRALMGRARSLSLQRRFHEALNVCEQLLVATPDDADTEQARADFLADAGQLEQALAAFTAAQSNHGHAEWPSFGRARTLAALGRYDEALSALPRAERPAARLLWTRGMIFLYAGDSVGAEALFAAEVTRPFTDDRDRFRMGLALARLRQRDLTNLPALLDTIDYKPLRPLALAAATHVHLLAGARDPAAHLFHRIPTVATPALLDVRAELGRRLAGEPALHDDDRLVELEIGVLGQMPSQW